MLVALDCEVYSNYFLALFKGETGTVYELSQHNSTFVGDTKVVDTILRQNTLVTFNGRDYDLVVLSAFLSGYPPKAIKKISDKIIKDGIPSYRINQYFPDLVIKTHRQIDLIGVTPLQASLKTYGCRIHSPKLQDLPIHPDATISVDDAKLLREYCENDVDVTWQIYDTLKDQIQLRTDMGAMYSMDLRSLSDAQIAERVIRQELEAAGIYVTKRDPDVEPFKYNVPDFISFKTDVMCEALERVKAAVFTVKDGKPQLPDELNEVIEFGEARYKFGIGGLHSQEKKQVVIPNSDELFGEFDVASMYPSIILGQRLYPKHLGDEFCDVYRSLFEQRLTAKRAGDKVTSDSLKIVLNSSYGKFGSQYSFLYSPELLIQTTITGQLALLMLIERMTMYGAVVKSANTDGINVLFNKKIEDKVNLLAKQWSEATGYELEWTPYEAVYARDVNNYVAFSGDKVKTKGAYELDSIRKGYSNLICTKAVIAYLRDGVPLEDTVRNVSDVRDVLTMRGVRGGAVWRGEPLGKVVRWYMSTQGEEIRYLSNGNKVATSDGAVPMMNLSESIPDDLDYNAYFLKSLKLLTDLGVSYEI